MPMRAFAAGFYSNLMRMYDYLGVKYHSQPFLFSFSRLDSNSSSGSSPYMVHASNFHQIPPVPRNRDLFQWIAEVIYVLIFYLWFALCCFFVSPSEPSASSPGETLDQYLRRIRLPEYYVASYLLPLISSVCTCSHQQLLEFPASDVLEYKKRTHRQNHYVVTDGVYTVQEKLLKGVDVRLGVHLTSVSPTSNGVEVKARNSNGEETTEFFDLAVLAVSPDVVASIFEPLQSTLKHIPTTTVSTVAHTDYATIPTMLRASNKGSGSVSNSSSQSIHFLSNTSITESIHEQPNSMLVTTNPLSSIDPSKTIQSASFTRVLRTPQSRLLINGLFREDGKQETANGPLSNKWRNGDNGVYLAGGWCWDGMVLLEGCIVSAMRVAFDLGVEIPWEGS